MQYTVPDGVHMLAGDARVIAFHIHLHDSLLAKVLSGVLYDIALRYRAKKKIGKLHRSQEPVEYLFLDTLQFHGRAINVALFGDPLDPLKWLRCLLLLEWLVLALPIPRERAKGPPVFAEAKFEIAQA